ncbi:hypothetical protein DPMN_083730 [Dreissena polymorpha]|uniref:Uncharacterized protein n=1 Tax=Dreissena polymorpha TaxID=45954 RepID=A0A9D4BHZ2_DREPO|nr:hypothetical protein DPMN_083730 [Dreissena polymorpha]
MFIEGSPSCLSFDKNLKSDDSTDSESMDQNEFVDDCSEGDDVSIDSIDSSDSIDQDPCNSSYYSDDETDSENLMEKESDSLGLPEKEFQALSLVSCFLRNKFSKSSSRDVINTFKSTFHHCQELSNLDFETIMSNIEDISLKVFHYCILCKQVIPFDGDIFRCTTPNCEGLRYKGALSNLKKKGREPVQCFLFTDIKKQLVDLLETPGNIRKNTLG